MQLQITIDLDNAAFEDDMANEVARILALIAVRFDEARHSYNGVWLGTHDINGNRVGEFRIDTVKAN